MPEGVQDSKTSWHQNQGAFHADSDGNFGNEVGIVEDLDGQFDAAARISIAADLGFSESIFIEDTSTRRIRVYTAQQEIPFAGHAVVGAAWYFENAKSLPTDIIQGLEGPIDSWSEDGSTWVRADLESTPPWWHERVELEELLDFTSAPSKKHGHVQLWAWIDEGKGTIRSRTFAPGWGIPEDEANGSGCMRLCACLGRDLTIIHGSGSEIRARYTAFGTAEIGGRVVLSESRKIALPGD